MDEPSTGTDLIVPLNSDTVVETIEEIERRLKREGRWQKIVKHVRPEYYEKLRKGRVTKSRWSEMFWNKLREEYWPLKVTKDKWQAEIDEERERVLMQKQPADDSAEIAGREDKFVNPAQVLDGDPDDPESIAGAELDELVARTKDQEVNVEADLLWAYHNMGKRYVRPKDAISYGAWSQLRYAKNNFQKFMADFNKALGKSIAEKRKSKQDDSLDQFAMLDAFEKGMATIE